MFVATGNEYEPSSVQWSQLCRHFEFHEILTTTKNFDESLVVGRGGFGKVYKGNIKNGSTVVAAAIKRLDSMSNQGASEFWAEVEMLSKLRHCHLVSLIGYCNHETEMILVYEYMPRGTLADHLHKLGTPLSWCQRLRICIGAARGLDYLHTGTGIEFGIIHRDVKSLLVQFCLFMKENNIIIPVTADSAEENPVREFDMPVILIRFLLRVLTDDGDLETEKGIG
ncbi:putative protein kinase RLK-Pelle-CrRLK1L-1 family [Helianthus annuus]|uniref:Protein kinase domain-containing protein n=1 Tax=Helianthus annuus TaxID=4232 RepID=A0A9K3I316_HELAN|nr:putative protein kinase RLK-Pelle-CrRLK1L-1 family [Helianthus annuus]KAJ0524555.1 putative protein kinase RLK-Pelle-CrRLK1L-1 family [Helianthus annuus]